MRRVGLLVAVLVLAGCGVDRSEASALPRFEKSCSAGSECSGRKCVQVGPNEQGAEGVCSRACSDDADCGSDAVCFLLGEAGPSCLALCSQEDPCDGGLSCRPIGAGGETACFVAPAELTRSARRP